MGHPSHAAPSPIEHTPTGAAIVLVAQTPPPAASGADTSKLALARQGAALLLTVALVGVVVLTLLVLILRRLQRIERGTARRTALETAPQSVDVFRESARRARTPTAAELEAAGPASDLAGRAGSARGLGTPAPGAMTSQPASPRDARPIALVTGAARRVGREIALELARAGCDVLLTYHSSADEARSLLRELAELGAQATAYRVDLSDEQAVARLGDELAQTLPRLDVLVHNASTYEPSALDGLDPLGALRQYRVNALAPLVLTSRVRPLLERAILHGGAAVVAMADIHAMGRPRKGFTAYSMSKAALVEMVHSLARELAPKVRVNGVAPGVVAWPEQGHESTPEEQARYIKRIPLGREGEARDAARAVRWLALEATYVTGEIVRVDGGRWLT